MKSKFIYLVVICLVAVLSLTLLSQSPASAFEGDEGSLGLLRDFTSGKVKPSLIPSDGFQRVSTDKEPFCNGSGCPSNAEKISRELRETLSKESLPARSDRVGSFTLREKPCDGTIEACGGKPFSIQFDLK